MGRKANAWSVSRERVGKPDANQDNTHQWLRNSGLKAETECFITATQA